MSDRILVLVHPGSCCGSADFNLGTGLAAACREALVTELDGWEGGIVVIDGTLSDELPDYGDLGEAIAAALDKAASEARASLRIMGSDDAEFNQVAAIGKVVSDLALSPAAVRMVLTGAWYDADDDEGCVNSVYDRLAELGFQCDVADSAFQIDSPGYPLDDPADDDDAEPAGYPR